MPVVNFNGQKFQFPDGTAPEAIEAEMESFSAQQSRPPIANALTNLLKPLTQPSEQVPFPVIPGNTFGMTPDQGNALRQTIGNTNQTNAEMKIRDRIEREKQMEIEKDRAQELKLQQQQYKNQMSMEKFRQQQETDRLKAEADAEGRKPVEVSPGATLAVPDGAGGYTSAYTAPTNTRTPPVKSWFDEKTGQMVTFDGQNPSAFKVEGYTPAPSEADAPKLDRVETVDPVTGQKVIRWVSPTADMTLPAPPSTPREPDPTMQADRIERLRSNIMERLKLTEPGLFATDEYGNQMVSDPARFSTRVEEEVAKALGKPVPPPPLKPGIVLTGPDGQSYEVVDE